MPSSSGSEDLAEVSSQDDYVALEVELTEEHMEGLEHGSSVTFEYTGEDGKTLAVNVCRADKEADVGYIIAKSRGEDPTSGGLLSRLRGMVR